MNERELFNKWANDQSRQPTNVMYTSSALFDAFMAGSIASKPLESVMPPDFTVSVVAAYEAGLSEGKRLAKEDWRSESICDGSSACFLNALEWLNDANTYQSKDWINGDIINRIEWLRGMYEDKKVELELWIDMAEKAGKP